MLQSTRSDIGFNVGDRYTVEKYLGSGVYGHVVKATDKNTGEIVAIKKLHKIQDIVDAKRLLREIRTLRLFKHPCILQLKNVIFTETDSNDFGEIYLVTNKMDTDLHKLSELKFKIPDDHLQFIIYQILAGLNYIHSANVIHRDLKPSNILINTADCMVQTCDFGFARQIDMEFGGENQNKLTEYVVSRCYRAPEIILSAKHYSKGVDVWSVGCMLAELMTGSMLFKGTHFIQLVTIIMETLGKPKDLSFITNDGARKFVERFSETPRTPLSSRVKYHNKEALDLLQKMLQVDPSKRITVEEALKHPYLKDYYDPKDHNSFKGDVNFKFENDPNITLNDVKGIIIDEINAFKRWNKEKEVDKAKILHPLISLMKSPRAVKPLCMSMPHQFSPNYPTKDPEYFVETVRIHPPTEDGCRPLPQKRRAPATLDEVALSSNEFMRPGKYMKLAQPY
jgi:mitogen-activated protein kinase 1/3